MSQELRLRIVFGLILAVVVLAATWFGGIVFNALVVLTGALVFYEWTAMGRVRLGAEKSAGGLLPPVGGLPHVASWVLLFCAALALIAGHFSLAFFAVVIGALVLRFVLPDESAPNWLSAGLLYAGISMVSIAAIRSGGAGLFATLFVFAVVWSTDIMAYFVGRSLKGPKLAPSISPGKTWSGALGGCLFAVIAGLLISVSNGGQPGFGLVVLVVVMSAFSQAGDLFESALKRMCGVKDSSHLIPGHGGVMDRVDGLVAAAFLLFLVTLAARIADPALGSTVGDVLWHWTGIEAPNGVSGA